MRTTIHSREHLIFNFQFVESILSGYMGSASNYLFLQKVNSTLLIYQLGSEALLAKGQPLPAEIPKV
jgi:hypothetical protein